MAAHQGLEQGQHRFRTDTIALGEFCDVLLSFRRKLSHTGDPAQRKHGIDICIAGQFIQSADGPSFSVRLRSARRVAASGAIMHHKGARPMAQNRSRLGSTSQQLIWHVRGMDDTSVLVLRWHACPFCTDHLGRSLSKCVILCGVTWRTISNVDRWMSKHDACACWLSFYISLPCPSL